MMGLVLIAKTLRGTQALREAIESNKNAPLRARIAYNTLYLQTVLKEEPLTLRIEHKQKKMEAIIPPLSIFAPIEFALRENGALKSIDYEVMFDE